MERPVKCSILHLDFSKPTKQIVWLAQLLLLPIWHLHWIPETRFLIEWSIHSEIILSEPLWKRCWQVRKVHNLLVFFCYWDFAPREEHVDGPNNSLDIIPAKISLCSSWFLQEQASPVIVFGHSTQFGNGGYILFRLETKPASAKCRSLLASWWRMSHR